MAELDSREVYRSVFGTEQGHEVLTDILNDCGFFSQEDLTEVEIAKLNVAKKILEKSGIWEPGHLRNIVDKLFELPILKGKEHEKT